VNSSATYSALRAVLLEHGAPPTALTGLAELAELLTGRHGLSASAATRWMTTPNARLEDRRPLDAWLDDGAGPVLDIVRAETTRRLGRGGPDAPGSRPRA
jgi:hypothetical protein